MSDFEEDDWTPPTEAELKVLAARRERSDKISKRMGDYLLKGYKMLATTCPICQTIQLQDKQGQLYCVACQEIDCHETSKDDPAVNAVAAEKVIAESAFASRESRPLESSNPDVVPENISSQTLEGQAETGSLQFVSENLSFSSQSQHNLNSRTASADQQTGSGTESLPPLSSLINDQVGVERSRGMTTIIEESSSIEQSGARPKLFAKHSHRDNNDNEILEETQFNLVTKLHWANQQLSQESRVQQSDNLVKLIKSLLETIKVLNDVKS